MTGRGERVEEGLARDRRLVIITGPGHGASTDPGHRYSLDDCAAAAGEVLAALDIREPVDWVGNAWGGHVGIVFAATWPDRCRTLITFGTPVQAYGRSAAAPVSDPARASTASSGWWTILSAGSATPCCRRRLARTIPMRSPWCRLPCSTMERRALANAMVSISLERPDLTRAPRVDPLPDPVRHWRRSSRVDGRAGGSDEPAARHGLGGRRPRHRVPDPARGARGDDPVRPRHVGAMRLVGSGRVLSPPSTKVRAGDRVDARIADRERIVEVVQPIESRVGAAVAATCYVDHSPPVVPEAGPGSRSCEGRAGRASACGASWSASAGAPDASTPELGGNPP